MNTETLIIAHSPLATSRIITFLIEFFQKRQSGQQSVFSGSGSFIQQNY